MGATTQAVFAEMVTTGAADKAISTDKIDDTSITFWRFVPTSQRPIQKGCPGLIYTKGIGEAPLVQMATFSDWESLDALKNFAYNSPEHKEAIKRTHRIDWYKEEMFARFQPYRSMGSWGGQYLLSRYLKN